MSSYYDNNKPTVANSCGLNLMEEQIPHFPTEGLYIGTLSGGSVALPALYDIRETKGLCFLYNSDQSRQQVNICIEILVWRIALTTPANLCDLILYNGGNPGEAFNAHSRINKYLFGDRKERIFFDGNYETFNILLNEVYSSIIDRMSTIRCAGKRDLVELNETLGNDARIKYQFIVLTDFPRHLNADTAARLSQIVEAGSKAGIYVIMSWDMNADVEGSNASSTSFNPQQMLSSMELLFPQNGNYYFRNSGHDDVLNKFSYTVDSNAPTLTETDACLQQIDILAETAKKMMKPTILKQDFDSLAEAAYVLILGSERFAEMKRKSPLVSGGATTIKADNGFDISSGVVNMDFFFDDNGDTSAFAEQNSQFLVCLSAMNLNHQKKILMKLRFEAKSL